MTTTAETSGAVTSRPGGCTIRVRVIPRAGRTMIGGIRHGAVVVRVAAAPADGQANRTVLAFLADLLALPPYAVRLVAGAGARDKRIAVDGVDAAAAVSRLTAG